MAAVSFKDDLVTRREAIRRVSALLGGVALVGQGAWLAGCAAGARTASQLFSEADVALLDEVADTILPETKTPGAKAADVGAFIAVMVADTYAPPEQRLFVEGLVTLEREAQAQNGIGFMASSPAQRTALLERLDREAIDYMRQPGAPDPSFPNRRPSPSANDTSQKHRVVLAPGTTQRIQLNPEQDHRTSRHPLQRAPGAR